MKKVNGAAAPGGFEGGDVVLPVNFAGFPRGFDGKKFLILPSFWKVMRVDGEAAGPCVVALLHGAFGEGLVKEGDEGLGEAFGEGAKACAETGAEDEGLFHEGISRFFG